MIRISFPFRFSLDDLINVAPIVMVGLIVAVFLGFTFAKGALQKKEGLKVALLRKTGLNLDIETIGEGPFCLKRSQKSPLALAMEKKLVFLAESVRPDLQDREKAFCIRSIDSEKEVSVKQGEPLYFHIHQNKKGVIEKLELSLEKGEVKAIPKIEGRNVHLQLEEEEVLLRAKNTSQMKETDDLELLALKKARWLGTDPLFFKYGGAKYRSLGLKQKLRLPNYVLYVDQGDFLNYKEGKWLLVDGLDSADRSLPLAFISKVGPTGLEIEAWDVEGFTLFQANLKLEKEPHLAINGSQLIQSAKLRSKGLVSCQIGKKRLLLREGDWLIKSKNGWRKLIHLEEIQAYINHNLEAELFVVDHIDSNGMMKVQYFDKLRSETQTLSFPLHAEMKKPKKKAGIFK